MKTLACISARRTTTLQRNPSWCEKKQTNKLGKIKWDVSKWCLRPGFLPLAAKLPGLRGGSTSGTIKLSQHQPSQPSGDPHSALMSVKDFCGLKKKKNTITAHFICLWGRPEGGAGTGNCLAQLLPGLKLVEIHREQNIALCKSKKQYSCCRSRTRRAL